VDIEAWLHALGLGQYAKVFADNDIDAETLKALTAEDLKDLGVASLGHRKRLSAAIADLAGGPVEPGPPAEGERRQVTVLFCDLAGYTELTRALGAETVHAVTERFFQLVDSLIERFGGAIDKHIGDCVMGVFGAPTAHGNDPERAVRAALAIREAVPALGADLGRPIGVHIGIASGQVVASGGVGHRAYSITGDSVNLASRLTDAAEVGTILISDAVRRLLGERVDCAELGALDVKGFAEPVRAWRLVDVGERAVPRPRPFVGRQAELRQFEAVLQACLETKSGQTVFVRGEAGIGKTHLVEEFRRWAEVEGFAAHTGLVLDFGAATGQDAIRSIVRSLLELPLGPATRRAPPWWSRRLPQGWSPETAPCS
jgi:class 3 adenylate cyclase